MSTFKRAMNKLKKKKKPFDLMKLQEGMIKDRIRVHTAARLRLEGKMCKWCGSQENLTRHHASYMPARTIILCKKCHEKLHLEAVE